MQTLLLVLIFFGHVLLNLVGHLVLINNSLDIVILLVYFVWNCWLHNLWLNFVLELFKLDTLCDWVYKEQFPFLRVFDNDLTFDLFSLWKWRTSIWFVSWLILFDRRLALWCWARLLLTGVISERAYCVEFDVFLPPCRTWMKDRQMLPTLTIERFSLLRRWFYFTWLSVTSKPH